MTITNCTISGNSTTGRGGGVRNNNGLTIIRHSTITNNTAPDGNGSGVASFDSMDDSGTRTEVHSSIIAGNTNSDVDFIFYPVNSFQSNGHNLIGTGNSLGAFNQPGDQTGVANPMLGPLADNVGRTKTHALLPGSPAIDAGDPAFAPPPTSDQRGAPFVRVADGDATGGARIDIGAFERQSLAPSNFIVDSLSDENDGDYSAGDRSLREVISLAHASVGAETITFAASLTSGGPATIVLTQGQLAISDGLTINGPGAGLLTIDASGNDPTPTINNGDGSRVFHIDDGNIASNIAVSISSVTITGGDVTGSGGGFLSTENLTLSASRITGNAATLFGGGIYNEPRNTHPNFSLSHSSVSNNFAAYGGGVAGRKGAITILGSTINANQAIGAGGGINTDLTILDITNTTISGNVGGGAGGGTFSYGGEITITSSTISSNSAIDGGGVYCKEITATIISSTVSGNSASDNGGGVFARFSILTVNHSTITGNAAAFGGGGLYIFTTAPEEITHSIVAGNTRGASARDDIYGAVAVRFSLIGDRTGATITDNGGNQIGTSSSPINPLLGPLADNGGPTRSHALLAGSPAIDTGNALFAPPPANDQRGAPFARVADGDATGGARIDLGAYERQTVPGLSLVVDTLADESDGNYAAGDRSLREAIGLANGSVGANSITFAPSLTSGGPAAIVLTQGDVPIRDTLAINGPGPNLLTIDASGNDPTPATNDGNGSRVFNIDNGDAALVNVEIAGLLLTGGDTNSAGGGAILNVENLALTSATISGNFTTGSGGGILGGNVTLTSSTISGNATNGSYASGGGISASYVSVTNSTIAGNSTSGFGSGGGLQAGIVTITGSTISGNTAIGSGGGISAASATVTNSTISGNASTGIITTGGGISASFDVTVTSSTITGNSVAGSLSDGGGIHVALFGPTIIRNSIVAGNLDINGGSNPDLRPAGSLTLQYSLIGDNNGTDLAPAPVGSPDASGNLIGTHAVPIVPQLGPLANNGGSMTHALLPGSPAIDRGDPAAAAGVGAVPQFDQRGAPFARVFNGDGAGGARIDMGAFERQPLPAAFFGDYNRNGIVDAADYVVWRKMLGSSVAPYAGADGNGSGTVGPEDFGVWRAHFGQSVPQSAAASGAASTQVPAAEPFAAETPPVTAGAIQPSLSAPAPNVPPVANPTVTFGTASSRGTSLKARDEALATIDFVHSISKRREPVGVVGHLAKTATNFANPLRRDELLLACLAESGAASSASEPGKFASSAFEKNR